jgi:hypothetical protein
MYFCNFSPSKNFLFLYVANAGTGDEEIMMEMNPQQKEFLEMSCEFSEPANCSSTDVLQVHKHLSLPLPSLPLSTTKSHYI